MRRSSFLVVLVLLVGLPAAAVAQSCPIVVDVNRDPVPLGSFPSGFLRCGSAWFFGATTVAAGRELWRTDGTPAGTALVRDFLPGPDGGVQQVRCEDLGGGPRLWIVADDGVHGSELWTSDGTAAGTRLVIDVRPGPEGGVVGDLIRLGNQLVFEADDGTHGAELWITDGTSAGTRLLLDANPGPASSTIFEFGADAANGRVFMALDDGQGAGVEPWTTDGTPAGTRRLADLNPGPSDSTPLAFVPLGQAVLFTAVTGLGRELWRTDGTTSGTRLVRDIEPGPGGSVGTLRGVGRLGGHLYFDAFDAAHGAELWRTDGTSAGTTRVADIHAGSGSSQPFGFVPFAGNQLLFAASDGMHGRELWLTDGTAAGTRLVVDFVPGPNGVGPSQITSLGTGTYVFRGGTNALGFEVFVTDGTAAGTTLLQDVMPGRASSEPRSFASLSGTGQALFVATGPNVGSEARITAGTPATTRVFVDIEPTVATGDGAAEDLAAVDRTLFFQGFDSTNGFELWKYERTRGAVLVADIIPGRGSSLPAEMCGFFDGVKSQVVFRAQSLATGMEPWVSDGTPAGTLPLADLVPGGGGSSPQGFVASGPRVFFGARTLLGEELYVTDGTPTGTLLLGDLWPGVGSGLQDDRIAWRGGLLFAALRPRAGIELWWSDGTTAGTREVVDLLPGFWGSEPRDFVAFQDRVVFSAAGVRDVRTLWATDGTAAGTVPFGAGASVFTDPTELTPVGGLLFFSAESFHRGRELWVTDGTVAGTREVFDIRPGALDSDPLHLTRAGDRVVFSAAGPNGREPWISDGSAAGTFELADLVPGRGSSDPEHFVGVGGNGAAYFVATTAAAGTEWFETRGTPATTVLVCDIAPGSASSDPAEPVLVDGQLVFRALSPFVGEELHAIAPTRGNARPLGEPCGPTSPSLVASDPLLGTTLVLSGRRAPTGLPAAVLLGAPTGGAVPLLGSAPCALYLDLAFPAVTVVLITTPTWSATVPVPSDLSLRGVAVASQALFVDPGPRLLAATNGVLLTLEQ